MTSYCKSWHSEVAVAAWDINLKSFKSYFKNCKVVRLVSTYYIINISKTEKTWNLLYLLPLLNHIEYMSVCSTGTWSRASVMWLCVSSALAQAACWSRQTCWREASTSSRCRSSSTTTCRPTARTTYTGRTACQLSFDTVPREVIIWAQLPPMCICDENAACDRGLLHDVDPLCCN